ncbi:unnamed protein product [Victoria cruziana]
MNFIEALPQSEGKEAILVVADRLTKYAHFVALPKKYDGQMTVDTFQRQIGQLHGMPKSIICDQDSIFVSAFYREYMKMMGVRLNFSTVHHPQTDGQTEVTNRMLETYLRCFTGKRPCTWVQHLSWAEWSYNTSHHSTIIMTLHEAMYGYPPPPMVPFEPGTALDADIEMQLSFKDDLLCAFWEAMLLAYNNMRQYYNKGCKDREFEVGA